MQIDDSPAKEHSTCLRKCNGGKETPFHRQSTDTEIHFDKQSTPTRSKKTGKTAQRL